MLRIFFFLFILGWPMTGLSSSFEAAFQSGIKSYQSGKYNEAQAHFLQALKENPLEPSAHTNLGLVYYKLGQMGSAIAHWRKALSLHSSQKTAQEALHFVEQTYPLKQIPHKSLPYESFRTQILNHLNLDLLLFLISIFTFLFFWSLFNYLGHKKRSQLEENPPPKFPYLNPLYGLLLICFLILMVTKYYDLQIPRATVISKSVQVLTGPSTEAPFLYELFEGLEVIVNNMNNDWAQITYPGGLTGWVPKNTIYQTTGKKYD